MYACSCRAITEDDVRRAGRRGVIDPDELIALFGLDDPRCCGRCEEGIDQFVALAWEGSMNVEGDPSARPGAAGVEAALACDLAAPRRGRV
jgi:bacterioferritin-associated ferredoxin